MVCLLKFSNRWSDTGIYTDSLSFQLVSVSIDTHAEHPLILVLAVLSDHQHVLLGDQMGDAVMDLLGSLGHLLYTLGWTFLGHNLLRNSVNDLTLDHWIVVLICIVLDDVADHYRQLLVLFPSDLDLLLSWLALCWSLLLSLLSPLLSLHCLQIVQLATKYNLCHLQRARSFPSGFSIPLPSLHWVSLCSLYSTHLGYLRILNQPSWWQCWTLSKDGTPLWHGTCGCVSQRVLLPWPQTT